jgi:NAD(P)-dependent dehydrogenase (short-subunit alcohol dehydrogenase family)
MARVALVTGGTRGIGEAICKALRAAGYTVAANYGGNDEAAAKFKAETGIQVYKWDVASYEACAAGIKQVEAEIGPIDILVNNAGISVLAGVLDLPPEDWDRVLETNLHSCFLLSKYAAESMVKRGSGGKIINISSEYAHFGTPAVPSYAAAKGALDQLTKSMAIELAPNNIQVNAIVPGWITTDMTIGLKSTPFYKLILARTPARRFGEPEELAGAAVFLASRASDFVTGTSLFVDGGYAIG